MAFYVWIVCPDPSHCDLGEALEVPEGFGGTGTPDIVQLRHPQSGTPAMFLFSPGDGMVQEVLTFSENRR
jgi:hypothetical protein